MNGNVCIEVRRKNQDCFLFMLGVISLIAGLEALAIMEGFNGAMRRNVYLLIGLLAGLVVPSPNFRLLKKAKELI